MRNRVVPVIAVAAALTCAACDSSSLSPSAPRTSTWRARATGSDPTIDTGIVINEFATRLAPNEECSEFVELRNDSSREQSLGGWRIEVSTPGTGAALYTTIPVAMVLAPGCHLLIATAPSGLPRDVATSCNLADNGGLALLRPDGTIADQVGMSTGSEFREGTPLEPFSANATRQSYTRVHTDTNDNASDFIVRTATPQNRFAACTKR